MSRIFFISNDICQESLKSKNYFVWAGSGNPCAVIGDDENPVSVTDVASLLKEKGLGWVLVEKKNGKKTIQFLDYDINTKDKAEAFCKNE